jgi:nitroreductase
MATNQQLAGVKEKAGTTVNTLIGQVIPSAILAASAHNTQPWKFKVTNNTVDVFVDWDRHLAVSDPSLRELYISIGCAVTNILIAAKYWDYAPELSYFPEGEGKKSPVARIVCNKTNHPANGENAALFTAIVNRRTDRNTYDKQLLSKKEKQALPVTDSESVILLEDNDKIEKIAELTEEATIRTLSRKDFKEELSHWVRNNWTSQHDGMPGYAMGIPAPLSLLGSIMVRLAPIHKQEGPKTKEQMNSSSAVVIIGSETDSLINWVKSGQAMEQVWLEATATGLSVAPLIASVEAGEDTRSNLKQILGTNLLPQSVLRIGHAEHKPLRSSPRRTLEECLV